MRKFREAWTDRDNRLVRLGVDGKGNDFTRLRAIVQFPVGREVYDWFFNARTGYRGQYWICPKTGTAFNDACVGTLRDELLPRLGDEVDVAKIRIEGDKYSRQDFCLGRISVSRKIFERSLTVGQGKLWLCEHRQRPDDKDPDPIGPFPLARAGGAAHLVVPRWAADVGTGKTGEGLRTPYPDPDDAWIDLKGGFFKPDGTVEQAKTQDKRAEDIHKKGWT